jgi:hypothetical protein
MRQEDGTWRWRSPSGMPDPISKRGLKQYESLLVGQPALLAFEAVGRLFDAVKPRLP